MGQFNLFWDTLKIKNLYFEKLDPFQLSLLQSTLVYLYELQS